MTKQIIYMKLKVKESTHTFNHQWMYNTKGLVDLDKSDFYIYLTS